MYVAVASLGMFISVNSHMQVYIYIHVHMYIIYNYKTLNIKNDRCVTVKRR